MILVRLWKKLHNTYLKEAWSTLYWNTGKANVAPCFWSHWIKVFLLNCIYCRQRSTMFNRSLTSTVVPLHSSNQQNSYNYGCALGPVGFSLSGTMSLFSFSIGITLLCKFDEGLPLGTEMATGRQKWPEAGRNCSSQFRETTGCAWKSWQLWLSLTTR